MAYVVQQPYSNTNDTDKFRVVDAHDLTRYMNGATKSYAFVPFDSYKQAAKYRDELNKQL